jgi:hypothetical protein
VIGKTGKGVVLAALVAVSSTAGVANAGRGYDRAISPDPATMLVDGVVIRPLGLGAIVLGAATWLVTYPFSAISGNAHEAGDQLVGQAWRFTFQRPLGEFRH